MTINALSRTPNQSLVLSRRKILATMHRQDREFLPAALEILETPPSPVSSALIKLICGMVVAALAWSYFGHLDIIAEAKGKIQPVGRIKIIQPLETGKVQALKVASGQHVSAGDVLVQLENAEAVADETAMSDSVAAWRGEVARRKAAIDTARARAFDNPVARHWPEDVPLIIREREERIFMGDIGQLEGTISSLEAQARQKAAGIDRLKGTVAAQSTLVDTLRKRVDLRAALVEKDAGSKVSLIDAMETMQTEQATLTDERGQLAENIADAEVIPLDITKTVETFIADNAQRLSEAERQADDLAQKLAKASARAGYTVLASPIDGTVTALAVTTVGQVVGSGMELMRIVPDSEDLEIEAYLMNRDIGFVNPGQSAIVKLDSFPFTQYGSLDGQVIRVSTDAIPAPDATQTEGDPTTTTRQVSQTGGQRVQNLVYPVTLSMQKTYVNVDGKQIHLISGMTVSVEVRTGRRRVIEYLLSPLVDVASRGIRER